MMLSTGCRASAGGVSVGKRVKGKPPRLRSCIGAANCTGELFSSGSDGHSKGRSETLETLSDVVSLSLIAGNFSSKD